MHGVQLAQKVARAIGWLFVAAVAFHAVRAWSQAARAASDGKWGHAAEVAVIAVIATAIVAAAIANATRSARARK